MPNARPQSSCGKQEILCRKTKGKNYIYIWWLGWIPTQSNPTLIHINPSIHLPPDTQPLIQTHPSTHPHPSSHTHNLKTIHMHMHRLLVPYIQAVRVICFEFMSPEHFRFLVCGDRLLIFSMAVHLRSASVWPLPLKCLATEVFLLVLMSDLWW